MPMITVEAQVDLKDVIDNALLSDVMDYLDYDQVLEHILKDAGSETLTDQLTLPQLLRALANRLEKEAKRHE